MYIGLDFDGTCVTHEYPHIGKDIGAIPVLKALIKNKHQLILNTMRSDVKLKEAINWFQETGVELFGIQKNPTQRFWTTSTKVYAHLYIDDAAIGCPLIYDKTISDRQFVDWIKVESILKKEGYIIEALF